MEMEVEIGGRPKSLHERDGAALGLVDAVIPSHAAVQTEESPDEDAQYRGHHLRVIGQTVAQGEGQRKNPLACRNMGKDAIHQVGCGIGHTPSATGRTHASALCRTAAGAAPFRTIHTSTDELRILTL